MTAKGSHFSGAYVDAGHELQEALQVRFQKLWIHGMEIVIQW